jgi:hypothetical protein
MVAMACFRLPLSLEFPAPARPLSAPYADISRNWRKRAGFSAAMG